MKLFLIRHGETDYNKDGRHQGWHPAVLSEAGIKQANRLYEQLKDIHFDQVVVSDLQRTKQTAEIVFKNFMDCVTYSSAIREINTASISGKTYDVVRKEYGDAYIQGRKSFDYSFCGGESSEQFRMRILEFLKQYESEDRKQTVAVLTHGGAFYVILSYLLGVDVSLILEKFSIENCGVLCIEYHNQGWKLKIR